MATRIARARRAAAVLTAVGLAWLLSPVTARADTFSIAAVDTASGAMGSAGASCVGPIGDVGAFILSDIVPQHGVIHTQASYLSANQRAARERMLAGDSPDEIVAWLEANDARGDPGPRQYGIVDLTRDGASAAFTGDDTIPWAGHRTGRGYAVQGNILAGPEIIADMERAFLEADGPLDARLMAALEAAKVVGADTRCAERGTSSRSAFLTVARPDDDEDDRYLELVVPDSEIGQDPIDLLRAQYDAWRADQTPHPVLLPLLYRLTEPEHASAALGCRLPSSSSASAH